MSDERKWLGVVLAGGFSRRFGMDKASYRAPDGRSLIERAVALLATCGMDVCVSARAGQHLPKLACPIIPDCTEGLGPLGGVVSILRTQRADAYLFLTCDMPNLTPELIMRLRAGFVSETSAAVYRVGERVQCFPLALSQPTLEVLQERLKAGQRDVQSFLQTVSQVLYLDGNDSEKYFVNMNTVEEAAKILNLAEERA